MEQDGLSPLQVEAKREPSFPLGGCSNFVVSCLYENECACGFCETFHSVLCLLQRMRFLPSKMAATVRRGLYRHHE